MPCAPKEDRAPRINILGDGGRADKTHRLDSGVVKKATGHQLVAVNDAWHVLGQPRLDQQFRHPVCRRRIPLGGLQDKCIFAGNSQGEHPQRHHCRKIERGDARNDAQGLALRIAIKRKNRKAFVNFHNSSPGAPPVKPGHVPTAAYSVHILTATGVFGLLSLLAVIEGDWFWAFIWLGMSLLVDGLDGPLVCWVRVKQWMPDIDGASLDYVIDFFTYTIIPAVMIWRWELVPQGWALVTASAILLASCYPYANAKFKTSDFYFIGFPAIWSLLVFTIAVFAALSILIFSRVAIGLRTRWCAIGLWPT